MFDPDSCDHDRVCAQTDDASMKEKVMDVEGAKDEAMLNFRRDSRNMLSILLMFFSKLLAVAFRYNMKVSDNNKNNNDDNDDDSDGGYALKACCQYRYRCRDKYGHGSKVNFAMKCKRKELQVRVKMKMKKD